jgi:hypothetical protein
MLQSLQIGTLAGVLATEGGIDATPRQRSSTWLSGVGAAACTDSSAVLSQVLASEVHER